MLATFFMSSQALLPYAILMVVMQYAKTSLYEIFCH